MKDFSNSISALSNSFSIGIRCFGLELELELESGGVEVGKDEEEEKVGKDVVGNCVEAEEASGRGEGAAVGGRPFSLSEWHFACKVGCLGYLIFNLLPQNSQRLGSTVGDSGSFLVPVARPLALSLLHLACNVGCDE